MASLDKTGRTTAFRRAAMICGLLLLGGCTGTVESNGLYGGPLLPIPKTTPVESPELALLQGQEFLASRKYSEAHHKFTAVLEIQPDNFEARLGVAEANLGAGNLIEALAGFESVMDAPNLRSLALQGRGIVLSLIGRRDMGQDLLTQAVELDPELWRAWNAIGRNHSLAGRSGLALEAYAMALRANAVTPAVHNNLGLALAMQGRAEEAEAAFGTALRMDPDSRPAQMNLRLSLASQGRYSEAMAGVAPGERPAMMNNVGYMALQRGDLDVARSYFVKAMETSPSFYEKAAKNLEYLDQINTTTSLPSGPKD